MVVPWSPGDHVQALKLWDRKAGVTWPPYGCSRSDLCVPADKNDRGWTMGASAERRDRRITWPGGAGFHTRVGGPTCGGTRFLSPGLPSRAGRLQLQPVALSVVVSAQRPTTRQSGATLYARRRCRLSDPSAIPRLSTYSMFKGNVPVLFHATCCERRRRIMRACDGVDRNLREPRMEPDSLGRGLDIVNKSIT